MECNHFCFVFLNQYINHSDVKIYNKRFLLLKFNLGNLKVLFASTYAARWIKTGQVSSLKDGYKLQKG